MSTIRTKSSGMEYFVNFSIPLFTPSATTPAETARKMVLNINALRPEGTNSPKSREKDFRKYWTDHPPTML